MERKFYKRHRDDDIVDRVVIELVPRFKESELSGDEWRVSGVTRLYRKGELMHEQGYRNVESAAAHLPWLLLTWTEGDAPEWVKHIRVEHEFCHQPSCAAKANVIYRLKAEYSREGFKRETEPDEQILRAFCARHSHRGDCGLEDNDRNYEQVYPPKAVESAR